MINTDNIDFIDNTAATNSERNFICLHIDLSKAIESWRLSVFSFEWLDGNGKIKPITALSDPEQAKRKAVEDAIKAGKPLAKPVLGLGLQDNIEIGTGRAEFLTCAALGLKTIPVHIPKSNESDFKAFAADVNS